MTLGRCLGTGKSDCTRLFAAVSLLCPLASAKRCPFRPAGKLVCLLRVGISETGKMMCNRAGQVFLYKASVRERTPMVCSCISVRSSKMLGSCVSVSESASAWLACFTLFHPPNVQGADHSPSESADHRSKDTGRYNYMPRRTPAGPDKVCVCWSSRLPCIGSPCPLVWLSASAHLRMLRFRSHRCSALFWGVCTLAQGPVMRDGVK